MKSRYQSQDISNFLNICTFLDPRFKLSHLSNENSDSRLHVETEMMHFGEYLDE